MSTFLIRARYSSGAWARMLKITDDRAAAARTMFESLGGSLECMFWDVENGAAYAIAQLPDSVTAAAVLTALTKTGSFTAVETHELLTQEQLHDALLMARDLSNVYTVPGSAAFDRDDVGSFATS
jgi:uncharacterized protein with GYD domain